MKFLVFISLIFVTFSSFGRDSKDNSLTAFTTDGCSIAPDFNFENCCKVHDVSYWKGGTRDERKLADLTLKECIHEVTGKWSVATTYYWGVRFGGKNKYATWYRWGYGWTHLRGHRALSSEELEVVAALEPEDPTLVPVTKPQNSLKPLPSRFENYCLDEAYDSLVRYFGQDEDFEITMTHVSKWDHYNIQLKLNLNPQKEVFIFLYSRKMWNKCNSPIYNENLPRRFYQNVSVFH